MRNLLFFAGVALAALAGYVAPAQALPTLSFDLTCGLGGPPCGTTVYGTITLTQVDSKHVTIAETLAGGNVFAGSGAGDALAFNVSKAITIVNIQPAAEFVQDFSPKGVPYGTFGYAVDYTGNGTSPPTFASFSFTTTDNTTLLLSDFIANTAGYYFVSDIGVLNSKGKFDTGNVASRGPSNVPEPLTLSLLGTGLIGLGAVSRRRLA
jgi:hypothetical protein